MPCQHLDGPAQQQCRALRKAADHIFACNIEFVGQTAPVLACSIRTLSSTSSSCTAIARLAAIISKAQIAAAWHALCRGHQARCLQDSAQLCSKPNSSPLLAMPMQHLPSALGVSRPSRQLLLPGLQQLPQQPAWVQPWIMLLLAFVSAEMIFRWLALMHKQQAACQGAVIPCHALSLCILGESGNH